MAIIFCLRPALRNAAFAASLTPSLLPRSYLTRGVLSGFRPSRSRIAGLASSVPRRIVRAVHEPGRRGQGPDLCYECRVGTDADRLSPICERPGDLLRVPQSLSRTRLDAADLAAKTAPLQAGITVQDVRFTSDIRFCVANVRSWPIADIPSCTAQVRFRG